MVSPVLAQILRSGREHFNARFSAARRTQSELSGEHFLAFIERAVDPVVVAVDRVQPDRATDAAMAGYDVALELATQRIIGRGERAKGVEEAWRMLLVAAPALVAANPARMLGTTTNAILKLEATAGARPAQWIALMQKLGATCPQLEDWLKLGQVVAWRAGLAHFRPAALALADHLPEEAVLQVVGAPGHLAWAEVRAALVSNPWHDPSRAEDERGPRKVAEVGAFRGFGGLFAEPPRVAVAGDHFIVMSDGDAWTLAADAFGATLHRLPPGSGATVGKAGADRVRLNGDALEIDGEMLPVPGWAELTSVAATPTTAAVTSRLSHRVLLLALPRK